MVYSDYPENCIVNIYFVKWIARDTLFADEYMALHLAPKSTMKYIYTEKGTSSGCLTLGITRFAV